MAKLDGMIYQIKPLEKLESLKKNRSLLEKLGLIIQVNGIWLDGLI